MVKGEESNTGTNRRKSVASEEVQGNGSADLPSLEECRYLDDQGQHIDIEKLHHYHHYKTISEREQFEEKLRKGLLSMKDIAALQERLRFADGLPCKLLIAGSNVLCEDEEYMNIVPSDPDYQRLSDFTAMMAELK